jgi:hypothetical protein
MNIIDFTKNACGGVGWGGGWGRGIKYNCVFVKHKLEKSSKLTFYSTIKIDYELEKYLSIIKE